MSANQKFTLLLLLLVLGRVFDMYTTYLYIPDLKGETNVLVRWLGTGWTGVIAIHLVVVAVVSYSLYYYCFRFRPIVPQEKNLSLKQYISYFHFNSPNRFAECFYKMPVNRSASFAALGYVVPMSLIVISFLVGTSTLLLINFPGYRVFYKNGGLILLFSSFPVVVGFFYTRFFRMQYRNYKNSVQ